MCRRRFGALERPGRKRHPIRYRIANCERICQFLIEALSSTLSVLQSKLQQLTMEVPGQPFASSLVISLPGPDGRSMDFKVRAYEMMEPGLSRKFPALRTYQAVSISDPSVTAVLDLTYLGFHAMVMDPAGWYFIDPFTVGDSLHYIVYFKRDARSGVPFECGSGTASQKLLPSNGSQVQRSAGTTLRTYRLAVGCTGEYAAFFGGRCPVQCRVS